MHMGKGKKQLQGVLLSGLCFLTALAVLACGYQFSGSGSLPENISSLSVEIFENRTAETQMEYTVANDLIREFTRRDKNLLKEKNVAEASLIGTIASISDATVSHVDSGSSAQYRTTMNIHVQLVSNINQAVIWERKNVSDNEVYDISTDRFVTDQNKRDALEKISERLAETVYKLLTDNF